MSLLGQPGPPVIFSGVLGTSLATFPDFSRKPGNRGQTRVLDTQVSKTEEELLAEMHGTGNILESNCHDHLQGLFFLGWRGPSLEHPLPPSFSCSNERLELMMALRFIQLQGAAYSYWVSQSRLFSP